jgi:hypothetical protein
MKLWYPATGDVETTNRLTKSITPAWAGEVDRTPKYAQFVTTTGSA